MLKKDELDKRLTAHLSKRDGVAAMGCREYNMKAFQQIIHNDLVAEKRLCHQKYERRILMHETDFGEQIFIQYPGKESVHPKEEKRRLYDFRPKMVTRNGGQLKDLAFDSIWTAIESLSKNHHAMLYILATVFLRMGYMVGYEETTYSCERQLLEGGINTVSTDTVELKMLKLHYSKEVWESLEEYLGPIIIDDIRLSVEAFLFYFEYLIQNEDVKYYKEDEEKIGARLKSGRTSTCDTNANIVLHFQDKLSFGKLLQKLINGRGVCRIAKREYPIVTDKLFFHG